MKCKRCLIIETGGNLFNKDGICEGCKRLDGKIDWSPEGFGMIVEGIYNRAVQDATMGSIIEKRLALSWIMSESFYYYIDLLAMRRDGMREGILDRIEREKKTQYILP